MTTAQKTIGILALQGDFHAHQAAIEAAGGRAVEVRSSPELDTCDGLIVPGGESTAMWKLLEIEHLTEPLRAFGQSKPIFGTCAGAILLAHRITNPQDLGTGVQQSLDLMDIDVERNAYGRQLDSRVARIATESGNEMEAVFIRAPIIRRVGAGSVVIARYNGDPVWVKQGLHMATTFHPELSPEARAGTGVHKAFLESVESRTDSQGR